MLRYLVLREEKNIEGYSYTDGLYKGIAQGLMLAIDILEEKEG